MSRWKVLSFNFTYRWTAAWAHERGQTHCCTFAGQSLEQPSTRGQNVHTLQRGCDLHAAQQSAAVNTGPGACWREFTSYTRTSPPTLACRVASTHARQPLCSSCERPLPGQGCHSSPIEMPPPRMMRASVHPPAHSLPMNGMQISIPSTAGLSRVHHHFSRSAC